MTMPNIPEMAFDTHTDTHTMDYIAHWAKVCPDKTALYFVAAGAVTRLSYRELDAQANITAQWLLEAGLQPGEGIALLMENRLEIFALAWGARRAGLYYTPISTHLNPTEVNYILRDCGARLVVATHHTAALVPSANTWHGTRYWVGHHPNAHAPEGFQTLAPLLSTYTPTTALPHRMIGRDFLYSSGTTGKPKGIKRPLTPYAERFKETYDATLWREFLGLGHDSIYLTMAPLYHAAPLRSSMRNLEWGGTTLFTERFDAQQALHLIEHYQVSVSQWVPTMMLRMLALPEAVRQSANLSSMRHAIHAAAPCPPEVKRRMIEWWGPVWFEYYGGSEGIGLTGLDSHEWLRKPGSVGRPKLGTIHIKDDAGNPLPTGQQGRIWFSGCPRFTYHNDPEKTAAAYDAQGCATFGDIGHVDADGYLYISGRRTDLILSGGVNIYPQEIENLLSTYPGVADVAVIGVPHHEFGEEVKAVIELMDATQASPALAQALIEFCRQHLAHLKCPRSVDFVPSLPRLENGKLYKRLLMAQYASAQDRSQHQSPSSSLTT